ncbi:MAG: hypothetical protein ACI8RU_001917 [Zhongshania aliphaticivorans]|jgi:hypothetical protein|uniref:Lipoprotein n=1 Tax=Zhongshania aliphaticivorans TaxID=1470434 RepID=A0A127M9F7_9GAMM|nr:hypothetical protein AZF00_16945 [Zhongshania aliphaticivorans]
MFRITFLFRALCSVLVLTLVACTSVTNVKPGVNASLYLAVNERYLIRFKDGSLEKVKVVRVGRLDFSDSSGHTHYFDQVSEISREEFSGLKTVGFVIGSLVLFALIGQFLVEDTLRKSED